MNYEKSCGAVIYRMAQNPRFLLIRQARNGSWSFPKGHVEKEESELETAVREVQEEVGLTVSPIPNFRRVIHYCPRLNTEKDVVYFLSEVRQATVLLQKEEVSDYCWAELDCALRILSFENDRQVLRDAADFLTAR